MIEPDEVKKKRMPKRGLGSPNMSAETKFRIHSAGGRKSRGGGRKPLAEK